MPGECTVCFKRNVKQFLDSTCRDSRLGPSWPVCVLSDHVISHHLGVSTRSNSSGVWLKRREHQYDICLDNCFISNLMQKILVYLHIIHLLNPSTCFEHYPTNLQEVYVVIVYMQRLVSSLSAGDCTVHRFFLNRCTRQSPADSDDTRGCMYTITS
jgi:hypothetical protein